MAWSPSSTEKFMQCPTRWWLDRQGVVGRERDESAQERGSEFHRQMADHWNVTGLGVSKDENVERAVRKVLAQAENALQEQNIVCVECVLGGPEEERLRHGRYPGTCDLVTDNGAGLTVTDYKTKATLDPKYVDAELRQTQRSWQFKQYAWFVQQQFGRPVTHVRKLLVAFKPSLRVWLQSYPVTQQELSTWHIKAEHVWHVMDEMEMGNVKAWQVAEACERYGWLHRCEYYETCWDGQPIEYKENAQ